MKQLVLLALLIFPISNEATELRCTDKNILEKRNPNTVVLSQENYVEFITYIRSKYSFLMFNECSLVQFPELYSLYKEVKENRYNRHTSSFEKSTFALAFIEKNKPLGLSWDYFDDPFDTISFPNAYITEPGYMPLHLMQTKERNLPENILELYVQRYKEAKERQLNQRKINISEADKKIAEEKIKKENEIKNETKKKKELEDKAKEEFYFDQIRKFYISSIIEKGETILSEEKEYIKKAYAKDREEFLQRVVIACYEMDCPSKLKNKFNTELKNKLSFANYGGKVTPKMFLIKYNRLSELKNFLKNNSNSSINKEELLISAHLSDSKIYRYLKYEFGSRESIEISDLDSRVVSANMTSDALSFISMEFEKGSNLYNTYFIDKFGDIKAKHILGYVNFDTSIPADWDQYEKKLRMGLNIPLIKQYVFEKPSWDSKKITSTDDAKFYSELKNEETDYEYSSFSIDDLKNNWIGFNTKEGKRWIHSSQINRLVFVDDLLMDSLVFLSNANELYDLPNGTKIEKSKGFSEQNKITILRSRWIDGELWFNVNLDSDGCDGGGADPTKPGYAGFNLWLKAFNGEKKNYINYSRGC